MKFYTLLNITAAAMVSLALPACHADNDELKHHHHGAEEEAEMETTGHNHGEIVLDPHMAEKMGVATEKVAPRRVFRCDTHIRSCCGGSGVDGRSAGAGFGYCTLRLRYRSGREGRPRRVHRVNIHIGRGRRKYK